VKREPKQELRNQPDLLLERTVTAIGAFLGILVAFITLLKTSPILAYTIAWFIALFFILLFPYHGGKKWRALRRTLIIILSALAPSIVIYQIILQKSENNFRQTMALFEQKLSSLNWIAYEPTTYDPYKEIFPTDQEIDKEIATLKEAGFNGIITFSSQQSLCRIPRIAKSQGFAGVIMGIMDIMNNAEIQNALQAQSYVDAYCVGQMFTDYGVSIYEILNKIDIFKKKSSKPISTTLRPNGYKVFPEIGKNIDWIFPDIHGNWYTKATANDILKQTQTFVSEVSELQVLYPSKPILLKMISFPTSEVPGASPEEQYNFYRILTEYVKSSMEFPERVYPSYFAAFDNIWKTPERGWPLGERHVGFFNCNGKCKEANIDGKTVCSFTALSWTRTRLPSKNQQINRKNQSTS
jgi:exo-beta-1,3-glucanase (GH17 family)